MELKFVVSFKIVNRVFRWRPKCVIHRPTEKKNVFPAELFLQSSLYPRTSPPDGGNICKRIAYELFTCTSYYVFWIFFASVYFPLLFFGKGVFFVFFFFFTPSVRRVETGVSACCQWHANRGNFSFAAFTLWVSGQNRVRKRSENQKFSSRLYTLQIVR